MVLHGAPGGRGVGVRVGVAVFVELHRGGLPASQLSVVQSLSARHSPPGPFCDVHTPGASKMSQRWPEGHDAEPQQMLFTQFPDWHCPPDVQCAPLACGVGVAVGVGVEVGRAAQMPPCPGALHTCPLGHEVARQQTPSTQLPD